MSITVRDIAQKAGVSPATVSLVINNKKGVSEKTRLRVRAIMEEYNYRPTTNGKEQLRLVVVKFRKHGIALEENQGFVAAIVDHIEVESRRLNMAFALINCDGNNVEKVFVDLNEDPPQGVIIVGTELSDTEYLLLKKLQMPYVVLDNSMGYEDIDSVVMDNRNIMLAAVNNLYTCGHRKIWYFKSNQQINNLDERYEGYLRAVEDLELFLPEPIYLTPTLKGAYKDMKTLLEKGKYVPKGAAVADNDTIAIGALKAIQEAGYQIPEDLSIIGVDDIPFSAVTTPALTTVRISREALGSLAIEIILKRIAHPKWPCMKMAIGGKLICRGTTRVVGNG